MAKGVKTGGRTKGVPNKATQPIKELAQQYGPEAIGTLATLMRESESDATKVAAAKELLDRGYGKPSQALTGEDGAPLFPSEIAWRRVGPDN